jgi:hypothetical protein
MNIGEKNGSDLGHDRRLRPAHDSPVTSSLSFCFAAASAGAALARQQTSDEAHHLAMTGLVGSRLLTGRNYPAKAGCFISSTGRSGGEGRSAATGGSCVRIPDHELSAFQAFRIVDFSTDQVLETHGVDEQGDTIFLHGRIVFIDLLVEGEAILKTGATATCHENAQLESRIAFLLDQFANLARRIVGKNKRAAISLTAFMSKTPEKIRA